MNDDLRSYINERYEKSPVRVVSGHTPDFKSKEEVDDYFNQVENFVEYMINKRKEDKND